MAFVLESPAKRRRPRNTKKTMVPSTASQRAQKSGATIHQCTRRRQLARAIGIEGPTLTHHLDALEKAGLVVRTRDPHDRRAVRLELTDAGRERHAELMQAVIAFNRQLRAGLDEAEIQDLRELLGKLERNVVSEATPAD